MGLWHDDVKLRVRLPALVLRCVTSQSGVRLQMTPTCLDCAQPILQSKGAVSRSANAHAGSCMLAVVERCVRAEDIAVSVGLSAATRKGDVFSSGQYHQRLWTRSIRSAPRRVEMRAAPRQVNLFERYTEQVQQPFALFTCTLHGRAGGGLPPPAAYAEVHVHLHLGLLRRALYWVRCPIPPPCACSWNSACKRSLFPPAFFTEASVQYPGADRALHSTAQLHQDLCLAARPKIRNSHILLQGQVTLPCSSRSAA